MLFTNIIPEYYTVVTLIKKYPLNTKLLYTRYIYLITGGTCIFTEHN